MASPRVRRLRKARAAAARAAAARPAAPAPAPAPAPVAAPAPAPEPVVIDMAPEEDVVVAGPDYSAMTKAELCEHLDARGIEYSRYASKADLVELAEG